MWTLLPLTRRSEMHRVRYIDVSDSFIPIFFIAFGLVLVLDRKRAARIAVEQQYRWFGLNIQGDFHRFMFALGGVLFILIGVALLRGLLKLKH
jgi:hypothetical protein